MTNFSTPNKTYVKSNNSVSKMQNSYFYSLIAFIIFLVIYNLIIKKPVNVIHIVISLIISIMTAIITTYILNIKEKKKIKNITSLISISTIIVLVGYNANYLVIILATIFSLIIKKIIKNINISCSIYGILLIIIYNYFFKDIDTPLQILKNMGYIGSYEALIKSNGTITSYLFGSYYLSPIVSMIMFFYLFHKKAIKYNLVFSYVLTFSTIMLIIGLVKGMNIYYLFFQLTTGNILFLIVYGLTDSTSTPTINISQNIYGVILALISIAMRFVFPEASVIISLIIGQLFINKLIEKITIKLKYNRKYAAKVKLILLGIALVMTIILCIVI